MNQSGTNQKLNSFAIEDTQDKCYRDVIDELYANDWKKTIYKKKSKLEKKK